MRKISVIPSAREVQEQECADKTVVVIDVLRATSVIATALSNGASRIYPFAGIEEAKDFYDELNSEHALLCGERKGHIIAGFHLGNSPYSYDAATIKGKKLILSTTNGSLAISRSNAATTLYTAAMVNVSAVAEKIKNSEGDLVIVCAGTNGKFSLDDALCAGMLIAKLEESAAWQKDDLGIILSAYSRQPGSITDKLKECFHLNYLRSIGYGDDIDYCLSPDLLSNVPILRTDGIRAWLENS